MEYRPRQPEHNVNVSPGHPLAEFGQLLLGLLAVLAVLYAVLGLVVDTVVDHLSVETEQAIYDSLSLDEVSALFVSEEETGDQLAQARSVLKKLQPCANLPYPVSPHLISSPELNAMAFPGGSVGITSGLLEEVRSEAGLAFVLAHELAHFHHRDHLRSLGRGVVLIAGTTLVGGSTDIGSLLSPALSLQMAQYSQSRESEADMEALSFMTCAYGDTRGAGELFEEMLKREDKSQLGHYFSSHPQTRKRLDIIRSHGSL